MSNETMIIMPLEDAPVENGYKPNFSIPRREDREAERNRLLQWGETLLKDADAAGYATVPYPDLLQQMADIIGYDYAFLKEDPWRVKDTLRTAGVGGAPDSSLERFNLKSRDNIIIYHAPEEIPMVKTRQYKKAMLLVKFLTLMLPTLSDKEMLQAQEMIDQWVKATRFRRHVYAMMRWYNQRRRLLDSRTKKIAAAILTPEDKALLSNQLLTMAAGRGVALDSKSIYQLDRLLQICGYQPGEVHSLLHRWQCGGHALVEHSATSGSEALVPVMNDKLLKEIEQQTAQVQSLLSEVLDEPEEEKTETVKYPALLKEILTKPLWTENELASLCQQQGLNLGVALEAINDYAIDKVGDTVVDLDGSEVYVTTEYKDQLLQMQ